MQNILIVDTETTGLDANAGELLEVAGIYYNIPSRSILYQVSFLLYAESNAAYNINKISIDSLKQVDHDIQHNFTALFRYLFDNADAIVAHNAQFDKAWIDKNIDVPPDKKWICTRKNVFWPISKSTPLKLVNICTELGVPVVGVHRALDDCKILLGALEKMPDIQDFLENSAKDLLTYHAIVSYDERQLAKNYGFAWDGDKKVWHARLTSKEVADLPFGVVKYKEQVNAAT